MSETLNCPFCGGGAEPFNPFGGIEGMWCVLCSECGAATGFEQTEAEAIAAWNSRHADAELLGLLGDVLRRKRCNSSCGDCDHDEDDGCALLRRLWELAAERGLAPGSEVGA